MSRVATFAEAPLNVLIPILSSLSNFRGPTNESPYTKKDGEPPVGLLADGAGPVDGAELAMGEGPKEDEAELADERLGSAHVR